MLRGLAAVLVIAFTPATSWAIGEDWEKGVGRVLCSRAGGAISTGSGFVVNDQGVMATSAHVVRNCNRIVVFFSRTRNVVARIKAVSNARDLALLRLDSAQGRPLRLSDAGVEKGSAVFALGFPGTADVSLDAAFEASLTSGTVEKVTTDQFGRKVVQTSAEIKPGNSGGPLMDACGRVVGVNTFLRGANGLFTRFAVASSELTPILRKEGVAFQVDRARCRPEERASPAPPPPPAVVTPPPAGAANQATPMVSEPRDTGPEGVSGGVLVLAVVALLLAAIGVILALRRPRQVIVRHATRAFSQFRPPEPARPKPAPSPPAAGSVFLVATRGPLGDVRFPVGQEPIMVGRDPTATVVLPPDTFGVSRRHLAVMVRNGGALVKDCESSAGTFVDGRPLQPATWTPVHHNQVIGLGGEEVQFVIRER